MNRSRMTAVAAMMAAVAALAACGGGGTPAPAPAPTPTPAPAPTPGAPIGTAGIFDVDYGQFHGTYTFLDDGSFSGVHFVSASTLAGHPHGKLSATNSVTNRESIAWANFIDDADQVGAQEPAGVFGRTFTDTALRVSITGSMGSFSGESTAQKPWDDDATKTLYGDPIPLAVAAGDYTGILRTVGIGQPMQAVTDMTLDAGGHLAATVGNCTFAGTLAQHGSTGVYDAQVQTSGASCGLAPTMAGISTPLAHNGGKPTWALQLDSADASLTAVFIVTKQ